jgi:hypothetical protein
MTTDYTMNLVMYGFKRVTRAAAVARGVVAECGPGVNTGQKIVGTRGDVILDRLKFTFGKKNKGYVLGSGNVKSYSVSAWESVVAFALFGLSGCLIVVFQYFQGEGNDGSMGWKVYWYSGFGTEVVLPSGVMMLTVCREITSGGGTVLAAQSQ